jgi:hypothetical protein
MGPVDSKVEVGDLLLFQTNKTYHTTFDGGPRTIIYLIVDYNDAENCFYYLKINDNRIYNGKVEADYFEGGPCWDVKIYK